MDSWKVVTFGEGFAVETPDPSPEGDGKYNVPGELIVRQDHAGIYGCHLSEKEARQIAAVPELIEACLAAQRYDESIAGRAIRGECELAVDGSGKADGDDLDTLYADWIDKARAALKKVEGEKAVQEKCKHLRSEELHEGQGGYDPNCTTWICLDCGHTWSYEIELEPRDPDDNF